MEKSKSKNEGLFQPSHWPDSRLGNLPEIFASNAVEVAVEGERRKGCVLPPIVQPTPSTVENTGRAIGRAGSFNLTQNDRRENLNDHKSRRFLNSRPNAIVIDEKVPNLREPMVEGLVRRDAHAAFVSTAQRAAVPEPNLRAGLDTKKSRNEKTVFQRRNGSLACPTSENVIIEEIYLLSLNKQAIPMEEKSQRQGICDHVSLRETRSDESNGVRGIHRFGEILSRRVYYGGSATDVSSSEELRTAVDMAREPRRQSGIGRHRSLRKTRSDESANGLGEIRPCGKICYHRLTTTSNVNEEIGREVNMIDETRAESEERSRERASEDNTEAASTAESEQEQRPQLQGVNEAEEEAKSGEEEIFACVVTAESVKRQIPRKRRQGVSEAKIETRDSKEENLACGVTAESKEKQEQRRRSQGVSKGNIKTSDSKEESLACGVIAESIEKQGQRRRRDDVCETVDKTAASRRRAKVLKKKLFGEDLPVDYELMIEHTIGRALNKRL